MEPMKTVMIITLLEIRTVMIGVKEAISKWHEIVAITAELQQSQCIQSYKET